MDVRFLGTMERTSALHDGAGGVVKCSVRDVLTLSIFGVLLREWAS